MPRQSTPRWLHSSSRLVTHDAAHRSPTTCRWVRRRFALTNGRGPDHHDVGCSLCNCKCSSPGRPCVNGSSEQTSPAVALPGTPLLGQSPRDGHSADRRTPPRRLGCDASVTRIVFGPDGIPLELGRSLRLFSPAQRRALAVRDGGCRFPGCTRPPTLHRCSPRRSLVAGRRLRPQQRDSALQTITIDSFTKVAGGSSVTRRLRGPCDTNGPECSTGQGPDGHCGCGCVRTVGPLV